MNNKELIIEISRIKELMALEKKQHYENLISENNILLEGPSFLKTGYQMAIHSDDIFKNTAKSEELLNAINKLGPKASQLKPEAIKQLASDLQSSRQLISNAAKQGNLSSLADDAWKKLQQLQSKVPGGIDNVPSITTKVEQKVFEALDDLDAGSTLHLANEVALGKTFDDLDSLIVDSLDEGITYLDDASSILEFEHHLDDAIKKVGGDPQQLSLYRKWATKRFKEVELPAYKKSDLYLPNGEPYKRGNGFNSKPVNPATDVANVAKRNMGYFRFLNGLIKKFKSWIGKYNPKQSLEENLNRLKAVDPATIMVDGKLSREYETIVRAINYDIEQIAGLEKTIDKLWEETISELAGQYPALVQDIGKVDIYQGIGITQKSENLDAVLERIKKDPAIGPENVAKITSLSDVLKKLFNTLAELKNWVLKFARNLPSAIMETWVEFAKKVKKDWFKMLGREVLWGNIRGPREIGKLFTKSGYGSLRKLFMNFVLQYARLLFFKKVFIFLPLAFKALYLGILESLGVDAIKDEGATPFSIVEEEFFEEFNLALADNGYEVAEYFSIVDFSLARTIGTSVYRWATTPVNQVEQELLRSKQQAFDEYWNTLSDLQKRTAVKNLALTNKTHDFGWLFTSTDLDEKGNPTNGQPRHFMKANNLTIDDIKKIASSLIPFTDLQVNIGTNVEQKGILDRIKKETDNLLLSKKNKEELEKTLNNVSGVVRDKQGRMYDVKDGIDSEHFVFTEYKMQPYFTVRKNPPSDVDGKTTYQIYYADEFNEVPELAELNQIKAYNPKGMNPDGSFDKLKDAEKFVTDANNNQTIEKGEQIDLKTLLKRL